MRYTICVLAVFLFVFSSCHRTDESASTVKNELSVKVYNATTWNSTTNKMDTVVGAKVDLISQSAVLSAVTDKNGVATFKGMKQNVYTLYASKDDLSNLTNKTTKNGMTVGYLIIGVYKSQQDIEWSASYPNAVIGGFWLADANCDGQIDDNDKVSGQYLNFEYQYKDLNSDGVIDVKDLLDGRLVQIDNLVGKTIYIGK